MDKKNLLHAIGWHIENPGWAEFINVVLWMLIIGVGTWLVFFIIRRWLSLLLVIIVGKTRTKWDDILLEQGFFRRLAYLVIPIVAYIVLERIQWEYKDILRRIIDIWLIINVLFIILSLLDAINKIYESYPVARNRPIKMFIQIIKVFLYTAVIVTIISVLLNKSPEKLILGLGAFAAVLMLIFKDSILGFVAGVQLIANKMVRIGDWIVMPENNANGEVLEINLYTVKVQNWDMTISTIPTYQLVSQSFTNWRGMQDSSGRRIKRYVSIDINSVHFLSKEEIDKLEASGFLSGYIQEMIDKLEHLNENKETVLDEQKLTNIGVFRIYLESWLGVNPDINTDMTHMVRQLQPTATGIPIEIYCFSRKQEWVAYEQVQSDVFDHVLAIVPHFNLKVFQYPDTFLPMQERT